MRDVLIVDRAFPGARRAYLPDLIVLWDTRHAITASPRPGSARCNGARPTRARYPCRPGFVLMRGPGIASGRTLLAAHIVDLAPTILDRLGVEAPAHMAGQAAWSDRMIAVARERQTR